MPDHKDSEPVYARLPSERAALLAGIDAIDWRALTHAYGAAGDVPGLLRRLLADDATVRAEAWSALYGNVWHQGTVYEATAHVVPFLLRMLGHDGPPGHAELLRFLAAIAEGASYLDVHARAPALRASFEALAAKEGWGTVDSRTRAELGWVEAANRAVGEGLPLYLERVNNPVGEVQRAAVQVIARLPQHSRTSVPALHARLARASPAWLRRDLVLALHRLMDSGPASQTYFEALLDQESDPRLRLAAAAAAAMRARQATPQPIEQELVAAMGRLAPAGWWQPDEPAGAPTGLDWTPDGLPFAIYALASMGLERGLAALLACLPTLRDPETSRETAAVLLHLAFGDGERQSPATSARLQERPEGLTRPVDYWHPAPRPQRPAAGINAAQRSLLAALADHTPLWAAEHDLLHRYGLPETREQLRAYLAGPTWTGDA